MQPFRDKCLSPAERARDLLARLTVCEKVGQLNQRLHGFDCYVRQGRRLTLTKEFEEEVDRCGELVPMAYNMVQKYVMAHSRFGIPVLMSSECPHGHQALDGYLLPVNLAMGATFNRHLVQSAFAVCGRQQKEMGVDLALISMLDVLRDPRWGRSEECYGEDPYLCARMAAAAVRGCQSEGVAVVAKHFCAQGEGTGGINASAARIGERELREIHLPPAAACCREHVRGMMAAYNEIDGLPCHANARLLTGILRGELGFDGVVMADGVAIDRLDALTGDNVRSGALALNAGVDISLWDDGFSKLGQALENGGISAGQLDKAVLRVLTLKFERGLFEKPYLDEAIDLSRYSEKSFPQSLELARQSLVLLKNRNGLLPLQPSKIRSIAVIGPNADSLYNQLGDYSPPLRRGEGVTLLQGIQEHAGNIAVAYRQGCEIRGKGGADIGGAVALVKECDAVILALGGSSSRFGGARFETNGAAAAGDHPYMDCGEGMDCAELSLCGVQGALARAVFACGKPTVTVLIQGRPYAVEDIAAQTDALICSFYPGPMGGQALAELIFGRSVPSGRLPVSIPRSATQLPVYYNHKSSYDAMRYHNQRGTPLFAFGEGLDYTRIEYRNFALSSDAMPLGALQAGRGISLRFTVVNTGEMDGYAVPLLYIRDLQASTVRRVRELKAFDKALLHAGERKKMTLSLAEEELAVWDAQMRFAPEKGDFLLTMCDGGHQLWQGGFKIT